MHDGRGGVMSKAAEWIQYQDASDDCRKILGSDQQRETLQAHTHSAIIKHVQKIPTEMGRSHE